MNAEQAAACMMGCLIASAVLAVAWDEWASRRDRFIAGVRPDARLKWGPDVPTPPETKDRGIRS